MHTRKIPKIELPRIVLGAAVALAMSLGAGFAQAITVSAADFNSSNVMQMGDATFRATGGNFFRSGNTVGVSSGFQDDELDISSENLAVSFGNGGAVIDQIVIGRLFASGSRGDAVNEAGQFITTAAGGSGGCGVCNFDALGNFSGPGGMASSATAGVWTFDNPFGDTPLSEVVLRAFSMGSAGALDSDFALVSISYTMGLPTIVPEPGTALMLGLGLFGLARFGRVRS